MSTQSKQHATRSDAQNRVLFGRYIVQRELGRGSFGVVYLCRDTLLGGLSVSVKLVPSHRLKNDELRSRFHRELRAGFDLDHPNVARFYEILQGEGVYGYSMEYVEGRNLEEVIRSGLRLSPEMIAHVIGQACQGLAALHSRGFLHRDIKPANLMITPAHACKILDLGLVRPTEAVEVAAFMTAQEAVALACCGCATATNGLVGTPLYIAPETVALGTFSERSDLYSLGLVMYELITGTSPFETSDNLSLLRQKVEREIEPPKKVDPALQPLVPVMMRALAREPERRFVNATAMAAALRAAMPASNTGRRGSEQLFQPLVESGTARAKETAPRNAATSTLLQVFRAIVLSAILCSMIDIFFTSRNVGVGWFIDDVRSSAFEFARRSEVLRFVWRLFPR